MTAQEMEITPYDFSGKTVRILMDDKGDPWWVATDVCRVLGLTATGRGIEKLDKDEVKTFQVIDRLGRNQDAYIINEPGLYRLLSRSNKKRAKKFQHWVFHNVLPSIRKDGAYSIQKQPELPQNYKEALQHLIIQVEKNEKLAAENTVLKPKAKVYDFVSGTKGLTGLSDTAKIIGVSPHLFTARLVRDKFCFIRRKRIIPYETYIKREWFEVKLVPARDGSSSTYRQTFITPLGVNKFREVYNPGPNPGSKEQLRLFT